MTDLAPEETLAEDTEKTAAIDVRGLTKSFVMGHALDDVTFRVEPGEVCGLIGQNGAGKTTLLRILATLVAPTRGVVEVGGFDLKLGASRIRQTIGYMPDSFSTYEELRVDAFLEFFANIYRLPASTIQRTIDDILELIELSHLRNASVSRLSLGARQRLALGRTLLHNPDVLLLDEPVSGLDPRGRVEMRELLKELGRMGKAVLISSHVLGDLADLSDSLLILERGRMVFRGTLDELRGQISSLRTIEVAVEGDVAQLRELVDRQLAVARSESLGNGVLRFSPVDEGLTLGDLSSRLVDDGFRITHLVERTLDLEGAFLRLLEGLER